MDLGQLRKTILEKVKSEIINQKISVYRNELQASIEFNISGIKECINQPCSTHVFITKLNLIADHLIETLETAEYIGYTTYQTHPKEHVLGYHYFKTQLGGVTLYFNVQVTTQKKLILYTITEKAYI